jgi:hypothetical protein
MSEKETASMSQPNKTLYMVVKAAEAPSTTAL